MVGRLVMYAGVCVFPVVVIYVLAWAWRWWTGMGPPRVWRPRRRRGPEAPTHPPIERLLVDLRCLGGELDRMRSGSVPAKVHRMRAVSMAYDDVLRMCCEELDVPVPVEERPLEALERLQLEAGLARAGARW